MALSVGGSCARKGENTPTRRGGAPSENVLMEVLRTDPIHPKKTRVVREAECSDKQKRDGRVASPGTKRKDTSAGVEKE
jgi:hypothetical protein